MAERKTPARRGPTRAAALKALGITKEDFELLKGLKESQVSADPEPERPWVPDPEDVKRVQSDFSDPQQHLEDRPVPEQVSVGIDHGVPNAEPVWYMRNLRGVEVGFRLSRQAESTKKRTQLKPRGQRGDMQKLEHGDLQDAELKTQVAYGLIEILPEGEALDVLKRQYTNQQVQVPPHIAALRNEKGEEYNVAPRTTSDEEAMGYKVADLNPDLMQGKLSDREIKRDGGFAQQGVVMEPVQTPRPGKIVSDGFLAPVQQDMGADNEKQAAVDAKLRAKQFEHRPEDNLGVKVTVEEPQRVQ
jgi:hypothetical protein